MIDTQQLLKSHVSSYKNAMQSTPAGYSDLLCFFTGIRLGWWQASVLAARKSIEQGDKEAYASHKKKLKAITPYGLFRKRRLEGGLIKASGVFLVDIDAGDNPHITNWQNARQVFAVQPWVLAAYVSLRGTGLNVFYVPDTNVSLLSTFDNARELSRDLGYVIDESGKDITRMCAVSYDPGCYIAARVEIMTGTGDFDF